MNIFRKRSIPVCMIFIISVMLCSNQIVLHGSSVAENSRQWGNQGSDIIYLTGFTPFLNYSINPSELIVQALNQTTFKNYTIVGRVLPVHFTNAPLIIQEDIIDLDPELIICLGLDADSRGITLETIAVNYQVDASLEYPLMSFQKIRTDGPLFLPTQVNIIDTYENLIEKDMCASISFSAGLYVCNAVFYETLFYLSNHSIDTPMGFIHIPQVADDDIYGMTLDTMINGVLTIIASNIS